MLGNQTLLRSGLPCLSFRNCSGHYLEVPSNHLRCTHIPFCPRHVDTALHPADQGHVTPPGSWTQASQVTGSKHKLSFNRTLAASPEECYVVWNSLPLHQAKSLM